VSLRLIVRLDVEIFSQDPIGVQIVYILCLRLLTPAVLKYNILCDFSEEAKTTK
jgi:hypothetical protein